ncbi:PH domain-containing protein [Halorubrum sp. AJ67]|uniref:PH domain-containing protein n=1 Tax=Halorubrum sp. AJ67 TaxID=1173487 RepID=UPI001896A340|nr:PH domain-containing protein [Halorubrum sp. AJ67]
MATSEQLGGLPEDYVPPSQRYGNDEGEGSNPLSWSDVEGPIHVKLILLVMVAASKAWHLKIAGLHWLLPRITGTADPKEGISGYFYPEDMIGDEEFIVHEGNPSRWVMMGPYVVAIVMLVVAVVVTIGVPLGYGEEMLALVTPNVLDLGVPDRWWYFPLFLVSLSVLLLTRQAIQRGSTWHIVTNRQILHRAHLLNTTKQRFDLHEIQNVEDHYPPPERFYGVGHIDFFTAGTGGSEVHFHGVDQPGELIKEIKYYMRQDKERRLRGGVSPDSAVDDPRTERSTEYQNSRGQQHQSEPTADQQAGQSPASNEEIAQQPEEPTKPYEQEENGEEESESPEYPWRQPAQEEGDSIEEQVTRQSLQDDMREINER